jgi:hypothetical protein
MSAASVKSPQPRFSLAELDSRFRNTQWVVGLGMVVVGILFALSTHAALVWLNRYFSTSDGPALFRMWPQDAIWWFFPGFGAVALSWEIVLQLWSDVGNGEDARLYNYWSIQKTGFDATRLLRWMAVLIVLPIGILTILALPMHAALRQDDIRDCGYAFRPCRLYRFADARRMTMIDGFRNREGKLTRRAGIIIDFSDGTRWSSAEIGDFTDSVSPKFAEFLQKRTQLPIGRAQTEADIPQLNIEHQ